MNTRKPPFVPLTTEEQSEVETVLLQIYEKVHDLQQMCWEIQEALERHDRQQLKALGVIKK